MRFRVTGDASAASVVALIKYAAGWWRQFEGKPAPGRRTGTDIWEGDRERFLDAVRDAVLAVKADGKTPTQDNVSEKIPMSLEGFRDAHKRYGFDGPTGYSDLIRAL